MSRVFVAEEHALRRYVVVKVFPSDSGGQVSIDRFKREIQVAAKLQHPHIVPVLSAGETGGVPYYVMPFVRGESLRKRLTRDRELPVSEALRIMRDIAAALAHAHAEGVIHRDIKPENVMLSGGVAVVTDFGVAKAIAAATQPGTEHRGAMLTSVGVALGTPAYMSPEQATADPNVDQRSDIYSLGCLAYEMLTGSSPFGGRSSPQTLAAHVTELPEPLPARRPSVSAALADLVMRCLEKRPEDRPQTIDEVVRALDAIGTPGSGTTPTQTQRPVARRQRRRYWIAGAALVPIAVTALALFPRRPDGYIAGADVPVSASPSFEVDASISPDGNFVAYASGTLGRMQVFVRQRVGGSVIPVSRDMPGDNRWPRWSPDGTQLAFMNDGAIYIVPALGGAPRKFVDEGAFPTWSPDGREIAYVSTPAAGLAPTSQALAPAAIWIRPLAGGEPRKLTEKASPSALSWSPNGKLLAFVIWNSAFLTGRNFNFAPCVVMVIPVAGGEAHAVSDSTSMNTSPDWAPDSRSILYVSNQRGPRDVFQQRIRGDGSAIGAPTRLTTGLNAQSITLSRGGTQLAYATLVLRSGVWSAPINASGATHFSAARAETNENESVEGMFVSRDGKWLLYDSNRSGNSDVYKIRLDVPIDEREPVQLTTDAANDFAPRLSPDGSDIAFYSMRFGSRDVFVMRADGTSQERVTNLPGNEYQPDWSPDARRLVFVYADTNALYTVMLVSRGANGRWSEPRPLSSALVRLPRLDILPARWSPDGSTIAVASNDSIHFVSLGGVIERSIGRPWARPTDLEGSMLWNVVDNSLIVHALPASGLNTFWSVPRTGGQARMLLRLDDPTKRPRGRNEFATDGRRIYFTIANDEADVRVMNLTRR